MAELESEIIEANELESISDIDEFALDKEWSRQTRIYMTYALQLAEAKKELLDAKAALDLIKAELDLRIRECPENYGLKKVTEPAIENAIILRKDYKLALKAMHHAKHKVDTFQAVVDGMEHRKKALENLVVLEGRNYFSAPQDRSGVGIEERVKKSVRTGRINTKK